MKFWPHPKFTGPESGYDIAIVQLKNREVDYNPEKKPQQDCF